MSRSALRMEDLGLGRRLAMARDARHLTQKAVADTLDVGRDTLSAWENAESGGVPGPEDRYPNSRYLRALCELYDVSADWLLWGEATRVYLQGRPSHLRALAGQGTQPGGPLPILVPTR